MSDYSLNNQPAVVNGIEYGWSSIQLTINNTIVKGITDISYTEAIDIQPVMGAGAKAVAYGVGNYSYSGSITIHKSELEKINIATINAGKLGGILELEPTDILVLWRNIDEVRTHTDVLLYCAFQSVDLSTTQGDLSSSVTIPFVFVDMKHVVI